MKKMIYGLAAVAMAVGAVAATKAPARHFTSYYWFPYTTVNHALIQTVTTKPTLVATDPTGCVGTISTNCSGGFTAYKTLTGTPKKYQESGSEAITHLRN